MTSHKDKWWAGMIKKYGSEEAARAAVGEGGRVGGLAKGPKGLASDKVSPEKKAEIQRKGNKARWAKANAKS